MGSLRIVSFMPEVLTRFCEASRRSYCATRALDVYGMGMVEDQLDGCSIVICVSLTRGSDCTSKWLGDIAILLLG